MLKLVGSFLGFGWGGAASCFKEQKSVIGQTHDDVAERYKVFGIDPTINGFPRAFPQETHRFWEPKTLGQFGLGSVVLHHVYHLSITRRKQVLPGRTRNGDLPSILYVNE